MGILLLLESDFVALDASLRFVFDEAASRADKAVTGNDGGVLPRVLFCASQRASTDAEAERPVFFCESGDDAIKVKGELVHFRGGSHGISFLPS